MCLNYVPYPQAYSSHASHRAEHLVAPRTTRRHRLFADSLLCSTLEFNGWLQHFALGVLMATHLSLVTVWRRWDLCGWRAAGVAARWWRVGNGWWAVVSRRWRGEAAVPRSKRAAPTAVVAFRERDEIMIG